jgi:hypothetical protein
MLWRLIHLRLGVGEIQLRDFCTGHWASVGNID